MLSTSRASSLLLSILLLSLMLGPSPLEAQGTLKEAVLDVTLPEGPGPVPVRLTYRFGPANPTDVAQAEGIPFSLLTPAPTRVREGPGGARAGFHPFPDLQQVRPHLSTGRLPFAPRLTLEYSVLQGWSHDHRLTLPIPTPGWVPENPSPRTFVARVRVPAGWSVLESFPTSVTRRPRDDGGGIYEVALQGVPSMLVLRLARGPAPFLTLERVLDLLVLSLLLVMGLWGLRHLREGGP